MNIPLYFNGETIDYEWQVMIWNENVKQPTTKTITHSGAGKNIFSDSSWYWMLSLTKGDHRTIYQSQRHYIYPWDTILLHVSLSFPCEHSRLTKSKTDTFPPPSFQLFPADPTVLPLFSWLSRKLPAARCQNHRAPPHRQWSPEPTNQTPEATPYTRSQSESLKTNACLNLQHISKATNKSTPGSYLNKGSISIGWRTAPFSAHSPVSVLSAYRMNYPPHFPCDKS